MIEDKLSKDKIIDLFIKIDKLIHYHKTKPVKIYCTKEQLPKVKEFIKFNK
jgi:hypothetical protein